MGYFRNNNSHGVRPAGSRIGSGAVVEATGDEAKALEACDGVEKLSDKEGKAAVAAQNAGPSADPTGDQILQDQALEAHEAIAVHTVAAPLQRVVGDDQAPLGPGTGETTTRRDEARKGVAERIAFADHDALEAVEEGENPVTPHGAPDSKVVHNDQHDKGETADEAAREQIETLAGARSGGSSDDEE